MWSNGIASSVITSTAAYVDPDDNGTPHNAPPREAQTLGVPFSRFGGNVASTTAVINTVSDTIDVIIANKWLPWLLPHGILRLE
jgi:hypothetical protein